MTYIDTVVSEWMAQTQRCLSMGVLIVRNRNKHLLNMLGIAPSTLKHSETIDSIHNIQILQIASPSLWLLASASLPSPRGKTGLPGAVPPLTEPRRVDAVMSGVSMCEGITGGVQDLPDRAPPTVAPIHY